LQELQETSFLVFMQVNVFNVEAKAKWVGPSFTCISNMLNKILNVLIDEIPQKVASLL
jgi:hypothetical protein